MQITLTPELERLIQEKVSDGRYASINEVIGESLRLLEERDHQTDGQLMELRKKIQVGRQELEQGLGIDAETVFAELEAEIQEAEADMNQVGQSA